MKDFYTEPTQVVFADPDNPGEWLMGIAHKDEIICACRGGVFEICDIIESAEELGDITHPIYDYLYWTDLANEICGGELPDGLEFDNDFTKILEVSTEEEYEQMTFGDIEDEEETWIRYFDSHFPQ